MIPAEGSAARPACARTLTRNAASSFSVTPASSQRAKYQYTVCHGGRSAGRYRHGQPARTTYKIALTISLRGCFSGRPSVADSGSMGSINAHWASVRSDG